ncbi:ROK family protein [Lactobacillus panisapium]|uniref:ROK family protein n=1 Tax=Lactobacillus panisapium TaxID=2012495 RepID=UPI001C698F58|nr:ROK family protein [Lactobacillus panisapium]QYN54830.1 ROK family protein [Lactobacillus panisapium]
MKNYLSIDIGGTEIKYAQIDVSGHIIEKGKVSTPDGKDKFLAQIDQIVQKYSGSIKGLAFCAPGKIDKTKIRFGGAIPFLDGIDFGQIYQAEDFPVAVINDGKASILAENWLGNLKDEKNCAAITLGTGVGSGIIVDGHLLQGTHNQAGEMSFMIADISNPKDMQGSIGKLCSAVRFVGQVNEQLGYEDVNDGVHAFEAIKNHVPEAVAIFEQYCLQIATLILNMQTVVDVNKIAIGGGISAQSCLIDGIKQAYDQLVNDDNSIIGQTLTKPEIVAAKFRNDSNLYGSLYNLLLQTDHETV